MTTNRGAYVFLFEITQRSFCFLIACGFRKLKTWFFLFITRIAELGHLA
jgi:hypothetical protein